MTISTVTIDLPLALTIAGVMIGLLGLVVTVVLHLRQIRAAIPRIDLTDNGLTVETPSLSLFIGTEPRGHPDQRDTAQLLAVKSNAEGELLVQLDQTLHAHTQLGATTMAELRSGSTDG